MSEYCGVDIIEVDRIKQAILETPGFKEKVFTKKEIEIGETKNDAIKYQYYAGRFAAKEAIYKSLSKIYNENLWLGDIEVLNDKNCNNRPYVNIIKKEIKHSIDSKQLTIDISISHIKEYAVANAVARFMK